VCPAHVDSAVEQGRLPERGIDRPRYGNFRLDGRVGDTSNEQLVAVSSW
jgi:hypothetical protein